MQPDRCLGAGDIAAKQVDRAGSHQPGRDHQNQRHRHYRRMGKARKRLARGDKAQKDAREQPGKGHDVMAQTLLDQGRDQHSEKAEKRDLVLGHGNCPK